MESNYVDEREDVQKKTFAKWINSQLVKNNKPPVGELVSGLRDGEVLLSLLEILTAQQYKRERGRMRVHHVNNVNTALAALEASGVKLVNISAADVVDGNPKLILGLVWSIIVHWQVHLHLRELATDTHHSTLERTLLAWCRAHTQNYSGVDVRDFTWSWCDGLALNALLHRWRPQLFDYASVLQRSPAARLEHAFALAHNHLGIPRLLDPEDVHTPRPDKKSIMMYVMCLFQALPHGTDEAPPTPPALLTPSADAATEVDAVANDSCVAEEGGRLSRPVSGATTASGELGGYGAALEDVLAWLLEAEERLAAQPTLAADDAAADDDAQAAPQLLHQLKEHFHTHERFLHELAEQQTCVGAVLEQGARLVGEGSLSRDEAHEVRLQMRLLNQRWEQLRLSAMARQAHVHKQLMHHQHDSLEKFRRWLTSTEDRISRMGNAGLAAVRALHADLRRQQPLVDALADCVVVVDSDADPSAAATLAEIEDRLTALGERWAHTCRWTLQRLRHLERCEERARRMRSELDRLDANVEQLEAQLKRMEADPAVEVAAALERCSVLGSASGAVARLRRRAARLLDAAQALRSDAPAAQAADADAALHRADAAADRLDALHAILQVQAQRIRDLGFEFEPASPGESSPEPSIAMDEAEPETATATATDDVTAPDDVTAGTDEPASRDAGEGAPKKPRLSSASDDLKMETSEKKADEPCEEPSPPAAARVAHEPPTNDDTHETTTSHTHEQDLRTRIAAAQKELSACAALPPDEALERIDKLSSEWEPWLSEAPSLRECLSQARCACSVRVRCAALEAWLRDAEACTPREHECRIADSAELYQVKARFQALKEKCDAKTEEFRAINEAGNDVLLAAGEGGGAGGDATGAGALARALTALNARWTQVTHGVYERYNY